MVVVCLRRVQINANSEDGFPFAQFQYASQLRIQRLAQLVDLFAAYLQTLTRLELQRCCRQIKCAMPHFNPLKRCIAPLEINLFDLDLLIPVIPEF